MLQQYTQMPDADEPPEKRAKPNRNLVTVTVAGQKVQRRLPVREDKKPENEKQRREAKNAKKQRDKDEQRLYADLEQDIFDARRKLQRLHSWLQRHSQSQKPSASTMPKQPDMSKHQRQGYNLVNQKQPRTRAPANQTRLNCVTVAHTPTPTTCPTHGDPDTYRRQQIYKRRLAYYKRGRKTTQGQIEFLKLFAYQPPCTICQQIQHSRSRTPTHKQGIT